MRKVGEAVELLSSEVRGHVVSVTAHRRAHTLGGFGGTPWGHGSAHR